MHMVFSLETTKHSLTIFLGKGRLEKILIQSNLIIKLLILLDCWWAHIIIRASL